MKKYCLLLFVIALLFVGNLPAYAEDPKALLSAYLRVLSTTNNLRDLYPYLPLSIVEACEKADPSGQSQMLARYKRNFIQQLQFLDERPSEDQLTDVLCGIGIGQFGKYRARVYWTAVIQKDYDGHWKLFSWHYESDPVHFKQ